MVRLLGLLCASETALKLARQSTVGMLVLLLYSEQLIDPEVPQALRLQGILIGMHLIPLLCCLFCSPLCSASSTATDRHKAGWLQK